jgi:hypothetical protein
VTASRRRPSSVINAAETLTRTDPLADLLEPGRRMCTSRAHYRIMRYEFLTVRVFAFTLGLVGTRVRWYEKCG